MKILILKQSIEGNDHQECIKTMLPEGNMNSLKILVKFDEREENWKMFSGN